MSLGAVATGTPSSQFQVTDSSLFVFTNVNVDTLEVGSVSESDMFAGAVINSAPDDTTANAFAPSEFVLGVVRDATLAGVTKLVFIPADDSVVIAGTRYRPA